MALQLNILTNDFIDIMNKDSESFLGYPENVEEAAYNFSEAIGKYAESIIPLTTTIENAKVIFKNIYLGMSYQLSNGELIFKNAMTAFAQQITIGMQPNFIGIVPALPIILEPVYDLGLNGGSGTDCAILMAQVVDTWFRTGVAINQNTGVIINWN